MMKYIKQPVPFSTNEFSIDETITEVNDVITIAIDTIKNINNVPNNTKQELDLALDNLNQAIDYLDYISKKTNIALRFVPQDIQEKEFL